MIKKPHAVLFDFDGVVVNSFEVHYKAWSEAFFEIFNKKLGDFPEGLEGKSPIQISQRLCEVGGDPAMASKLYTIKGDKLHSSTVPPKLLPGVKELTKLLSQQCIPYGIASNATKQFISNSINQLDIDFETFLGVEDYIKPKPDPEPYIKLAKALGVEETNFGSVIVFEDSITGATAAIKAGMVAVGIETQHPAQMLKDAGCSYSFKTLFEAYLLLKK